MKTPAELVDAFKKDIITQSHLLSLLLYYIPGEPIDGILALLSDDQKERFKDLLLRAARGDLICGFVHGSELPSETIAAIQDYVIAHRAFKTEADLGLTDL